MWRASQAQVNRPFHVLLGKTKMRKNEAMARYQNVNVLSCFTEKKTCKLYLKASGYVRNIQSIQVFPQANSKQSVFLLKTVRFIKTLRNNTWVYMILSTYLFFGCTTQFARSLFPHQASSPGRDRASPNHWTVRKFLKILNASHFILMKIKEKHGN